MMLTGFSKFVRAGTLAALFVVGSSAAAFALPIVAFTTNGTFSGSGTSAITFGSGGNTTTLTFSSAGDIVNAPSNVTYGLITVTTAGNGFVSGQPANTFLSNFTLGINQSAPGSGSASLQSALTGSISINDQSNLLLTFNTTTATIATGSGSVDYIIQPQYFIVCATCDTNGANPGVTTIQGALTATPTSTVPEPATMMLLGTGLVAAFRARRKIGIE